MDEKRKPITSMAGRFHAVHLFRYCNSTCHYDNFNLLERNAYWGVS